MKKTQTECKGLFSIAIWLQRCVPDTGFICKTKSWSSNSQGISTNSTLQPRLLPKIICSKKNRYDHSTEIQMSPAITAGSQFLSVLAVFTSHSSTCPPWTSSHPPLLQLHHPHSQSAAGDKGDLYFGFFQHFSLDHFSNLETCTCFSLDMNALSVFAPQTASFHSNFTHYSWKWNLDIYHWGNGGKHTITLAAPITASLGIL